MSLDNRINTSLGREQSFYIKVKLDVKQIQVSRPIAESRGQEKFYMVDTAFLIPDMSTTEFTKLINAYYEEDELPNGEEYIVQFPFPIRKLKGVGRINFDTSNNLYDGWHFMILTEEIDKEIRENMKIGNNFTIEIYPDSYEINNEIDS